MKVKEIAENLIAQEFTRESAVFRWQSGAILALQESAEAHLVHMFGNAFVFTHSLPF